MTATLLRWKDVCLLCICTLTFDATNNDDSNNMQVSYWVELMCEGGGEPAGGAPEQTTLISANDTAFLLAPVDATTISKLSILDVQMLNE